MDETYECPPERGCTLMSALLAHLTAAATSFVESGKAMTVGRASKRRLNASASAANPPSPRNSARTPAALRQLSSSSATEDCRGRLAVLRATTDAQSAHKHAHVAPTRMAAAPREQGNTETTDAKPGTRKTRSAEIAASALLDSVLLERCGIDLSGLVAGAGRRADVPRTRAGSASSTLGAAARARGCAYGVAMPRRRGRKPAPPQQRGSGDLLDRLASNRSFDVYMDADNGVMYGFNVNTPLYQRARRRAGVSGDDLHFALVAGARWTLLVASILSGLERVQLDLRPIYGGVAADKCELEHWLAALAIGVGTARVMPLSSDSVMASSLFAGIAMLLAAAPKIAQQLYEHSDWLGPRLGPVVTIVCTVWPLTVLAGWAQCCMLSWQASGWWLMAVITVIPLSVVPAFGGHRVRAQSCRRR